MEGKPKNKNPPSRMENLCSQTRVQLTGTEENKADIGATRDRKIPIQKSQSFKEKKKGQSWLQKQLSGKTGRDTDYIEMVHGAAVAAAAFSINLQETSEQKSENPEASLAKVKSRVESSKSSKSLLSSISKRLSGSFRSKDDQVVEEKKAEKDITPALSTKTTSSFTGKKTDTTAPKAPPSLLSLPSPIRKTSRKLDPQREITTGSNNGETSADEWERTVIDKIKQWANKQERTEPDKIKQRYEKLIELIDSWVDKKKIKAKRKLMKQQSELEKGRLKSLEKYVNLIADGTRAKAEESRKKFQRELERGRKKSLEKFQNKMKYVNLVADGARAKAEESLRKNEKLQAKGKPSTIPSAELIEELIDKYP